MPDQIVIIKIKRTELFSTPFKNYEQSYITHCGCLVEDGDLFVFNLYDKEGCGRKLYYIFLMCDADVLWEVVYPYGTKISGTVKDLNYKKLIRIVKDGGTYEM